MNNKGFTIVEVIVALGASLVLGGGFYLAYLVIKALQKYIGG